MRPRAQSGLPNLAVLHGLFESVHYVIPRGLDQTASVAQLAEQLICNQQVAGSTPAASSACPASRRRRTENSTRYRTATPSQPATTKKTTYQAEVTSTTRTLPAGSHPGHTYRHTTKASVADSAQRAEARGEFPERSKGSDCKSDGFFLRRFESCTPHCPMCPNPKCSGPIRSSPGDQAHVCSIRRPFDAGVAQW
jgi:hypothetical protein